MLPTLRLFSVSFELRRLTPVPCRGLTTTGFGYPVGRSRLSDLDWGVVMFVERWFTRLH